MSQIPARVAAEAAQAEAALAELAKAAAQPAEQPVPPTTDPTPTPAPTPTPTPAAPAQPPAASPPAPAPAPVEPTNMAAELSRMQSLLNTTLGRLEASNREMQQLRTRMEEATKQPPQPMPANPAITDKDRDEYGTDLIDLITRVCASSYGTALSDLSSRVAQLEGRVAATARTAEVAATTVQQTAMERYLTDLDNLIPGWQEVNNSTEFLDWLEKADNFSGKKRMDLLLEAHQNLEAGRVAYIFKQFKPDLGNAPQQPGTPAPEPQNGNQPSVDMSTLAAPSTAPAAPPPSSGQPSGQIWTQQDVDNLYLAKQRGRISNAEFAKREAEYFKALKEGRVAVT